MLREQGYMPRPVLAQGMNAWEMFGEGVEGFVYGPGEALPEAAGFIVADEAGLDQQLVAAFIRQLSQSGKLARVALLSGKKKEGPLGRLFGGGGEERKAREAAAIAACREVGTEWTVVRTGALRGGGTGSKSPHSLGKGYYNSIVDSVDALEEELFDMRRQGVEAGDVAGSGPFDEPETSRLAAAAALAESLAAEAAANKALELVSTEAPAPPTRPEWREVFAAAAAA